MVQQMADRRAETTPDVARLRDGVAGQGHDAFGNGFAIDNGALDRPGGADVLHQHADIGRAAAVRHFPPGQNFGQLLRTAGRVFGRDHAQLQILLAAQRFFQRGDSLRLVIFNADQHALRLQHPGEDTAAFQHLGGAILHQTIVGGDIRLALGGIDDQGIDAVKTAFQLAGGRKAGAAQAGDAGIVNALHDCGAILFAIVGQRFTRDPAIFAVRRNENADFRQARRVRRHVRPDRLHHAGSRRMHRQHTAAAEGQRLAAQHPIARHDADFAFMADMLF